MTNDTASPDGTHEQLVAIFTHELCHPLAPIRDAAALLRQDTLDADTIRRAAEIIERQASDMHRLIGDLLDVSRMQVGALELRVSRTLLAELVERAIESAAPLVRERGHTLHVSVAPDPVYLNIDVLRLSQALQNIITNASKFSGPEGHIHVRAWREDAVVVIVVCDTGIGIPADEIETIFGLFWRCNHPEGIQPGLGLGLYLARFLIEAHAGTITAASGGPGCGSVFTIRVPCELSMPLPAESPSWDRTASAPEGDPFPA